MQLLNRAAKFTNNTCYQNDLFKLRIKPKTAENSRKEPKQKRFEKSTDICRGKPCKVPGCGFVVTRGKM